MRLSTPLIGIFAATGLGLSNPADRRGDEVIKHFSVGLAYAGENFTSASTSILQTLPNNTCFMAVHRDFPYRPINSVSLGHRTTCAFFTLEACVQPDASDPVLVVEGPAKLPKLPENFSSRGYVKAYLCGEEAKKFIGNGTDLGVIEVRGRGQEGKETRRDDANSSATASLPLPGDGHGCTIYKESNFKGQNTFIPGSSWCTNLSAIYGSFEKQVRSVTINKAYQCRFYIDENCPTHGSSLGLGSKTQSVYRKEMGPQFEGTKSVFCTPFT